MSGRVRCMYSVLEFVLKKHCNNATSVNLDDKTLSVEEVTVLIV